MVVRLPAAVERAVPVRVSATPASGASVADEFLPRSVVDLDLEIAQLAAAWLTR